VAEPVRREARVLAEVARLVMTQFESRHLLTSAPAEMRTAFIHDLPKELHSRLGADFPVDLRAGAAEVAAAAEPAQKAIEEREEVTTVNRALDAGPEASARGERATLAALWERRVMTLAVEDTLCEPGERCRQCRALWEDAPSRCPACGSEEFEAVEDVVELAIEQALEQRAALELVRSDAARRLMRRHGRMAALLR
jgi:peptide subunit release factor 1 (eRF1)